MSRKYKTKLNPVRLFIITGEFDDYKFSCIYTKEYFENYNFPVKLEVIPNLAHEYPKMKEKEIWEFFINKV